MTVTNSGLFSTLFCKFLEFLNFYIYTIFYTGESTSSFSWHTESMTSLRSKALCIVINHFVIWFIYLSFSLAHHKNYPEYLMKAERSGIYSFDKILPQSLFLLGFFFEKFSISLKYCELNYHDQETAVQCSGISCVSFRRIFWSW